MHASLEMPSLRVELDDDDCDVDDPEALSFAIPVGKKIFQKKIQNNSYSILGDILSCQPNLYNCTVPLPSKSSSRTSAKSSTLSSQNRYEKVYTRTLNLLNTRQCTIPFELSVSDSSFLSIQPSVLTTLIPQSKVNIQCNFHLSQDIIDRFNTKNLNTNQSLSSTIEHGRRVHWREQLDVKFKQNEMEQIIPIDIRLYFPILTVTCDKIDFGTCFLNQTRQKEFIIKNLTCSSSAWSIRKGIYSIIRIIESKSLF
jgi:hypothetical protein